MKYSELVEQTKKELSKATDTAAILTELYNKAKSFHKANYDESVKELNRDYEAKRNTAAAEKLITDKNTGEFLASRGLSFSGESAQQKLNSDISFNNTLSSLADEHTKGLSELAKNKNQKLAELDTDLAQKRTEASKELYDNAIKMADNKIKYGEVSLDGFTEGDEYGGDVNTGVGDGTYSPAMNESQLANAIVKRFGENGTVETPQQSLQISKYLESLKERYRFTDEYWDNLTFFLDAYGYTAYNDESTNITAIINGADWEYAATYKNSEQVAKKLFLKPSDRENYAERRATLAKLDYVYTRCKDMGEFYTACSMMEFTDKQVREYLELVFSRKNTANRVELGERIN